MAGPAVSRASLQLSQDIEQSLVEQMFHGAQAAYRERAEQALAQGSVEPLRGGGKGEAPPVVPHPLLRDAYAMERLEALYATITQMGFSHEQTQIAMRCVLLEDGLVRLGLKGAPVCE